jgi:hypothetical protein
MGRCAAGGLVRKRETRCLCALETGLSGLTVLRAYDPRVPVGDLVSSADQSWRWLSSL